MFWIKIEKKNIYPLTAEFYYLVIGIKWKHFSLTCIPDAKYLLSQIEGVISAKTCPNSFL